MPDSDMRPDAATLAEVAGLAQEVERLRAESGLELLSGPASVTLTMHVEDAQTPAEAVQSIIERVAYGGLGQLAFGVVDLTSGDTYIVQNGVSRRMPDEP